MERRHLQIRPQIGEITVATCSICHSDELEFIQLIQVSEKEIHGTIPIFAKGGYRRITFRSVHICKNCGRITSYPVNEA